MRRCCEFTDEDEDDEGATQPLQAYMNTHTHTHTHHTHTERAAVREAHSRIRRTDGQSAVSLSLSLSVCSRTPTLQRSGPAHLCHIPAVIGQAPASVSREPELIGWRGSTLVRRSCTGSPAFNQSSEDINMHLINEGN